MNKKAAFVKWMDVVFTCLVLLFVTVIMVYLSFIHDKNVENKITELETNIGAEDDLITLLNQPVFFDFDSDGTAEKATVADLLDYSYENNDYSEFEKTLDTFLTPKYKTYTRSWHMRIYDSDGEQIKEFTKKLDKKVLSSKSEATLLFPLKNQNKPIKIVFFIDKISY